VLQYLGPTKNIRVSGIKKLPSKSAQIRFGRNLARLRTHMGLTQESLAEGVGISTRHEQSLEAGQYFASIVTLQKLKKALGCTWNELFAGL